MKFCLDFKNESCRGEKPLAVYENLDFDQLKRLYQREILHSNYKLVGFLSYEWGTALEGISPMNPKGGPKIPLNWFGLYNRTRDQGPGTRDQLRRRTTDKKLEFKSSFTKENYIEAIKKILNYLRAGDCYQVNLSQRFTTAISEDPWQIYLRLREISPAPYSAFIDTGSLQILSASPELFLQAKADGTFLTKPIKGTRRRGKTPEEDAKLKKELRLSPKDGAELLMITDLERNDLGKVCIPGSIEVLHLQEVETYAQVHHLVATIQGKRRKEADIVDCLRAMMPGGSITGAPKIRAMQIIRELEPVRRGVYTGAIGWIGPQNTGCFNIAIRTMVLQDNHVYLHAGGGIVIDSNPQAEYEETLTKAKGMMLALSEGEARVEGGI